MYFVECLTLQVRLWCQSTKFQNDFPSAEAVWNVPVYVIYLLNVLKHAYLDENGFTGRNSCDGLGVRRHLDSDCLILLVKVTGLRLMSFLSTLLRVRSRLLQTSFKEFLISCMFHCQSFSNIPSKIRKKRIKYCWCFIETATKPWCYVPAKLQWPPSTTSSFNYEWLGLIMKSQHFVRYVNPVFMKEETGSSFTSRLSSEYRLCCIAESDISR